MRASESDDDEFDPEDAWWLENERDQWEERGYLCPERVDRFIWDAHAEGGRIPPLWAGVDLDGTARRPVELGNYN